MTDLTDNLNRLIKESLALERAGVVCNTMRAARIVARRILFTATHGTPEGALEALDSKARALIREGGEGALRGLSARRQLAILSICQWEPTKDSADIAKAFDALRVAVQVAKAKQAASRVKA
jgi:hypothetical protein